MARNPTWLFFTGRLSEYNSKTGKLILIHAKAWAKVNSLNLKQALNSHDQISNSYHTMQH